MDNQENGRAAPPWMAGTWSACCQLTAGMLIMLAVMGWLAADMHGSKGLISSAMAGGLCWLGALLALLAISRTHGSDSAFLGILVSMVCRFGFVLIAFLVLRQWSGKIGQSRLVFYLLPHYGMALILETALAVQLIRRMESKSRAT